MRRKEPPGMFLSDFKPLSDEEVKRRQAEAAAQASGTGAGDAGAEQHQAEDSLLPGAGSPDATPPAAVASSAIAPEASDTASPAQEVAAAHSADDASEGKTSAPAPAAVSAPGGLPAPTAGAGSGTPLAIELDVDQIDPSPYQPRQYFDEDTLVLLAESMDSGTQINPITVRQKANGRYELVGGERRWRAMKMNGKKTVFAVVRVMSDSEARVAAVTDNEARDQLSDYERGVGYQMLLDSGDAANQSDLSRKIGVERTLINRRLSFQQLPKMVLDYFKKRPRLFGSRYVSDFLRFCEKDEDLVIKAVEKIYFEDKDVLAALNWLKGESKKRHNPVGERDNNKWQIAGRTFGELNTQGNKLLVAPSTGYSPIILQRFLTNLWEEAPEEVRGYLTGLMDRCSKDEQN